MLVEPACLPCILDDLGAATRSLVDDPEVGHRVMAEALRFLAQDYGLRKVPSHYITGVHRILKRITGVATPFADLRRRANELGLGICERLRPPADAEQRFRYLCRWAIAGNHLDFRTVGTGYGMTIDQMHGLLEEQVRQGLQVDRTDAILAAARAAGRVLYVLDNVGEIAFDRLLVRELGRYTQVVAAVRGGPITSDAVMEDARQVGLDQEVPLVVAGPDTLGISLEEMSGELRQELARVDLVITKGQANFYVMDEYRRQARQPVACLLSTKCDQAAARFGLRGKANVATLLSAPGLAEPRARQ